MEAPVKGPRDVEAAKRQRLRFTVTLIVISSIDESKCESSIDINVRYVDRYDSAHGRAAVTDRQAPKAGA